MLVRIEAEVRRGRQIDLLTFSIEQLVVVEGFLLHETKFVKLVARIVLHSLNQGLELQRTSLGVLFEDLLQLVDGAWIVALDKPRLIAVAPVEVVLELLVVKGQVVIEGITQLAPRELAVLVVFELSQGHLLRTQRGEPDPATVVRVAVITIPPAAAVALTLRRLATAPVGLLVFDNGRLVTVIGLCFAFSLVFVRAECEIVRISTLPISDLLRIPLDIRGIFGFAGFLNGYVRLLHLTAKELFRKSFKE